ncbi:protein-L-isoaspartate O-methyltransferase [Acuticoccus sp. I52.16.1]|uniref:protein-L-isoaspartate O-methyltransferase family protein n=1 Tax=Acuticoccus sp. I52.16.1 TaxID=2928472 RepID=UPI001FCF883F|nr:protein-L-isoaspartate O-methyltransferase [Acuticoccus sp. I52.16.1]UOM35206.1 protein-L-isoaspartate O-methyltransferase [Acuticoccus sp. I52.16.1]
MGDEAVLRTRMVNNQLRTFDVTDHRVQDAVLSVPREQFVPADQRAIAYSDEALPILRDSIGRPVRTMTRPAILGRLIQLAQPKEDDVVLLVGAGLGYTAAVLGQLAGSVIALECEDSLADKASADLEEDVSNVVVVSGPLEAGWPKEAPYDVIFVDGAILVEPTALTEQLKVGGRLVAVYGEGLSGRAQIFTKGEHGVSMRFAFNAAATVLPGFKSEPSFVF